MTEPLGPPVGRELRQQLGARNPLRWGLLILFAWLGFQVFLAWRSRLPESPFSVTVWVPERPVYRQGDVVRFTCTRTLKGNEPLPRTRQDSFEAVGNGISYPGSSSGSIIHPGTVQLHEHRQLPWDMAPGRYRLTGFAQIHAPRPVQVVMYESLPFEVVKRKDPLKR